jgi:hypothetical protein
MRVMHAMRKRVLRAMKKRHGAVQDADCRVPSAECREQGAGWCCMS